MNIDILTNHEFLAHLKELRQQCAMMVAELDRRGQLQDYCQAASKLSGAAASGQLPESASMSVAFTCFGLLSSIHEALRQEAERSN